MNTHTATDFEAKKAAILADKSLSSREKIQQIKALKEAQALAKPLSELNIYSESAQTKIRQELAQKSNNPLLQNTHIFKWTLTLLVNSIKSGKCLASRMLNVWRDLEGHDHEVDALYAIIAFEELLDIFKDNNLYPEVTDAFNSNDELWDRLHWINEYKTKTGSTTIASTADFTTAKVIVASVEDQDPKRWNEYGRHLRRLMIIDGPDKGKFLYWSTAKRVMSESDVYNITFRRDKKTRSKITDVKYELVNQDSGVWHQGRNLVSPKA